MRVFVSLFILCIFSCDSLTPDVQGKWVVYPIGKFESSSSQFKELFVDDRVNPVIYIDGKTIEYPFSFSGLESLEFDGNFIGFSVDNKVLKMEGQEFMIETIYKDSICLEQNNEVFMCLKRVSESTNNFEAKKLKFSSKDEFFNADIEVNFDGKISLKRSGVLSDTLSGELTKKDLSYLNVLVNRVQFSRLEPKYNPKASDVPNYILEIVFKNGNKVRIEANGYRPLPDIPYSLSALIYNLDKLSRRKTL